MIYLLMIPAALWGGVWWRFRGGAFTAMTGINPGTGGMRAISAVAMAAPLVCFGWWWALMAPALFIAWCLAGWGAFQGMGHETFIELKNPVARLLSRDRAFVANFRLLDLVGMSIEGMYCLAVPTAAAVVVTDGGWSGLLVLAGVLFGPAYYAGQWWKGWPRLGHFAQPGSEWGEVLVGMIVGMAITATAIG
jgi:hypothetical protein